MINFENTFQTLPGFLFEKILPTPISHPQLIHVTKLKTELGLDELSDQDLMCWLNGQKYLEGEQRIATRYAGHQFGVWAGQLGDGRAISLGEIMTENLGRQEIQTKGSGLTPFSRMGDGKAVIRSSVREYLCSEHMSGLNIPTSRVLALLTGDDQVRRESIEKSAVIARVFPTNIRFGHFELCHHFGHKSELEALIDYTRQSFFHHGSISDMLQKIVGLTAKLMSAWQSVGFCHGVMNTDNMSILGLTLDYGPYGFLEDTNLNHICNHSDHQGRYAYNQQPSMAMWNLERLLVCFMDFVPKENLISILNSFSLTFQTTFKKQSREKLGLNQELAGDHELFVALLRIMHGLSLDYTFLFRQLSHYKRGENSSIQPIWDYYGQRQELIDWLKLYDERLVKNSLNETERHSLMKKTNPKFVLRNYIAQEVIEDVELGHSDKLRIWLDILYKPFDEHPRFEDYAGPTPAEHKAYEVSCSS